MKRNAAVGDRGVFLFMHLKTPRYAGEFKKGEAVVIVTTIIVT